jgi:hypothetical protein
VVRHSQETVLKSKRGGGQIHPKIVAQSGVSGKPFLAGGRISQKDSAAAERPPKAVLAEHRLKNLKLIGVKGRR